MQTSRQSDSSISFKGKVSIHSEAWKLFRKLACSNSLPDNDAMQCFLKLHLTAEKKRVLASAVASRGFCANHAQEIDELFRIYVKPTSDVLRKLKASDFVNFNSAQFFRLIADYAENPSGVIATTGV